MNNGKFYDIIVSPLYSEKISILGESKKYAFKVRKDANKQQITKAFSEVFGVKLTKINVINTCSKKKVFKGRKGERTSIKKVIVTLEPGVVIDFLQGVK